MIYFIPSRKAVNIVLGILILLEVIACIAVGVNTAKSPEILWQVFSALLVCIFYSFGLIMLANSEETLFWRSAAICYIMGFVAIFVVVVLLIISILSEDGSAFEGFGDFVSGVGSDMGDTVGSKHRKKNTHILP